VSASLQRTVFLLPETLIDPATVQACRETHYRVHADTPVTLHVGVPSAALAALYQARRAQSCAFITACNPLGQVLEDRVNAE
jgi:siroheme synthase